MSEDYSNMPSSMQNNNESEPQSYTRADTPLPYVEAPSESSNEQPTPSKQRPEPLTEEARLAATNQLGLVIKRYKNDPAIFTTAGLPSAPYTRISGIANRRGLAAVNILITMLFIATPVIWISTGTPPWPMILICLLILAPWLGNIFNGFFANMIVSLKNTEFYLCTNGLMIIKWSRVQAIRWEQIRAVQRNMSYDLLRYSFILYFDERKPVTLDRALVGPELMELVESIECKVSQRLLPTTIAAYEAGQTLNFGSINVTPQGLTLEDEPKSLPWERFTAIENFNGRHIFIKEGKYASTWQKIEVASMLNLCVFLPLVEHIEESLRARKQKSDNENAISSQLLLPQSEWAEYEQDTL